MMETAILLYTSVDKIKKLGTAGAGLIVGLLIIRGLRDLYTAYEEEEGLVQAIKKIKKRAFAAIIAITVTSLVTFFKYFYQ